MKPWETLDALSHQFELCGIGPDTGIVALLPDSGDLADLVRTALARSGAEAIDVRPFARSNELHRQPSSRLLADLLASGDVVIDAMPEPMITMPIDGVAVLRLLPLAGQAERYAPHASLVKRIETLSGVLDRGERLHLGDQHGTDLTVTLTGAMIDADDAIAEANRIATFPGGWCRITPAAHTAHGELVLLPGDGNLAQHAPVGSPTRLRIDDDRVTSIEGEHADADTLRARFEQLALADDHGVRAGDDAYGVANLTIGLNPAEARRTAAFDERLVDPDRARLAAGVVTVSFGDNLHADRPGPGRLAFSLPRRSVTIDRLPIVSDGDLDGDFAPDVYELPG